ncbi:MAG: DUF2975 domain-containing protein [Desulfitobacterium sp.]
MHIKHGSTIFLKAIIFVVGIAVFALCIYWLPVLTIREIKTQPGVYSAYPFLVFAYGCCIAFSVALYQAFNLLTYIERNNAFSELSLKSLKVIKKTALIIIFFFALGIAYLRVLSSITGDDAAGPTALSLMAILATSIITAFIDALQKPLENLLKK